MARPESQQVLGEAAAAAAVHERAIAAGGDVSRRVLHLEFGVRDPVGRVLCVLQLILDVDGREHHRGQNEPTEEVAQANAVED